jgi:DNA-binding transcriptional ArsR family regulator
MVERSLTLDLTFGSLSNSTRRDMLRRVAKEELSVSDLSDDYAMSFAAVSKHLQVLEAAKLITKHRQGKLYLVRLVPENLTPAVDCLEYYKETWEKRFDALEAYLKTIQ